MPTVLYFHSSTYAFFLIVYEHAILQNVKWVMLANTKLLFIYHLLWKEFFLYGPTYTHMCVRITDLFEDLLKNMNIFRGKRRDTKTHNILYMTARFMGPLTHTRASAQWSTVQQREANVCQCQYTSPIIKSTILWAALHTRENIHYLI